MKSIKVSLLFLLICCFFNSKNFYAFNFEERNPIATDSLFIDNPNLKKAASIIKWQKENSSKNYTENELKNISISYALLNNKTESLFYLEKYIKQYYDVSILEESNLKNIKSSEGYINLEKKYKPGINGWILFFFSTGLIGLFLSVLINLRKKGDVIGNLLISVFVLFHSIFIIHLCLFLSNYSFNFPHTLYISTSFSFLYGPLLYFYFIRISRKHKFRLIDGLHLIPSLLLFLYFLPIYLLPGSEKLHLLYNRDEVLHTTLISVVILKCISLIGYAFLIFKVYRKVKSKEQKPHQNILNWQRNMMSLNFLYVLFYIIYGAALMKIVTSNTLIYPQIFAMSFIILYVGYTAYVQPKVFSKKYLFNNFTITKYKKSGLTTTFSNELKEELIRLLEEEKVFRQSNLNLELLAEKLGTTRHNISQVINEHFHVNYFNLINKYRVNEAIEILKNDYNNNLNIIDVAYDVGFNNKVTFNKAFKAEKNTTPSNYLKNLDNLRLSRA